MRQLTTGNAVVSDAEFIGVTKPTQGSEASQYLKEKKASAIPPVAASEKGTAQTEHMPSPCALYVRVCRSSLGGNTLSPSSYESEKWSNGLGRPSRACDRRVGQTFLAR